MNFRRVLLDRIWITLSIATLFVAIIPLVSIIADVFVNGISSLNYDFFTQLPPLAQAAGGGMADAIQGTLLLVLLSSAIGLPIGLITGINASEYGNVGGYGATIRFLGDVLSGVPSIVTGILIYSTVVLVFKGYSLLAGSLALGIMMIPIVANTSTQAFRAVPNSLREASTSLGVRKWRTSLLVVANAKKSVATACLLAIARITGETAPLILTAGISTQWFTSPFQPIASLTYYIYYFGTSPFDNWKALAWGAALFLLIIVLGINLAVRIVTREKRLRA